MGKFAPRPTAPAAFKASPAPPPATRITVRYLLPRCALQLGDRPVGSIALDRTRLHEYREGGRQLLPHVAAPLCSTAAGPSRGKLYGAGGISNGEHIVLRIAFKPTSTIGKQQSTVNRSGEDISLRCPPWRAAHMVDSLVRPIFLFT